MRLSNCIINHYNCCLVLFQDSENIKKKTNKTYELRAAGRNAPQTPFRPACPAEQCKKMHYSNIIKPNLHVNECSQGPMSRDHLFV